MKINAINNLKTQSFKGFVIANKDEKEKQIVREFILRQARIDKEKINGDEFLKAIDKTSTLRDYDIVVNAKLKSGKNKTRVVSADIAICKPGETVGVRRVSNVKPDDFMCRFKDYAINIGVSPSAYSQSKENG